MGDIVIATNQSGIEWPDGWPLPRVGDDVDTGERYFTVGGVVWKLLEEDLPYVLVQLDEV